MTAEQEYAVLGRTAAAHARARRIKAAAERAQALGVRFSVARSMTSCRAFPCLSEFFAANERMDRAAARRLILARSLRRQADYLLMYGVTL